MEPFSATAIFAGINSAFRFADFAVRIAEVGTENEVFVRTIQIVRTDLTEAQRLLSCESIQGKLKCNPAKLAWIKSSINSTRTALFEIGRWVERTRADQQAMGTLKFETRVRWVFDDHEKLINRQTELSACHQQLSNVLAYLTPLEELVVTPRKPPLEEPTDSDDLISPRQRMRNSQQYNTAHSFYAPSKEKHDMYHPQATATSSPVGQPNYPQQTLLSSFETTTSQYNPSSNPSSPPPTYASVIQTTSPRTTSWPNGVLDDTEYKPSPNMINPSLFSTQATTFACDAKSAEVYQHTAREYSDQSRPLTNDSWSMSGTNPSGPVDPLGMYAELAESPVSGAPAMMRSNPTSVHRISELLGDLHFRTELPGNDAGSPSGYSNPKSNTLLPRKPINSFYSPMPYADQGGANKALHELSSPPLTRYEAPSFGRSELLGCVSSSFRPVSSVPLSNHHTNQMTGAASSQNSVPQTQSASATRMRRQKTYMDMLGSLETG